MGLRARVISALLIGVTSTLACHEPTGSIPATMNVVVDQASVTASRNPGFGSFSVDALLTNAGNSTILVYDCVQTAEREVAPDRWEMLPAPWCALASNPAIELAPHTSVARHETIVAAGAMPAFPSGTLAGRYRLIYHYAAVGTVWNIAEARSSTFDVVE